MFCSSERERLLNELETYFRTDYMFQHWRVPEERFVVDAPQRLSPWSAEEGSSVLLAQAALSPELRIDSVGPYLFLRPSSYSRLGGTGRHLTTCRFIDTADPLAAEGGADALDVIVHDAQPLSKSRVNLTIGGEKSVGEVAEFYVQELGKQVVDYRIIGAPGAYQKKGAVGGADLAQFECWKVQVRTAGRRNNTAASEMLANRDVVVIVVQRRFIPPMADRFQNVVVVGYSRYQPLQRSHANALRCELVADSLAFNSRSFTCDTLVIQTKANALVLDEGSLAWCASNLAVYPEAARLARAFCQSVLRLISRAGVGAGSDVAKPEAGVGSSSNGGGRALAGSVSGSVSEPEAAEPGAGDLADVSEDPFEYSLRLENRVPWAGEPGPDSAAVLSEWKARVWRYLAYCLDGGMFPGVLDLARVVALLDTHPRRLQRLSQLLQTLLYLRAEGHEYRHMALALKVADERLMSGSFTLNERVMERLLETGFLRRLLDETKDPLAYSRFIVRLLQRGKDRELWGFELQYAVCKQLARASAAHPHETAAGVGDAALESPPPQLQLQLPAASATPPTKPLSDLALHTIVPSLIDLLNDESSNEKTQVLVVSTIVNLTKNNMIIKNKVMAGGAIRRVCAFLHSKHDDLVRHSCSLLNNCTKSEQYRGQVAKYKAIEALMRLLQRNSFPPHYRSTRILIQACAVVGNLASDDALRQRISSSLGYEVASDRNFKGKRFEQSRAIRVLIDLLLDRYGELTVQRDNLRVTVIFALKNLAVRSDENKVTIGRLALEALLGIVDTTPNDERFRILVDVALRCIYVLSFERANVKILRRLNVDKVLQSRHSAFLEITRAIQNKLSKMQ